MHDEKINRKKLKFIGYISFLLGFSQAVLAYIISSYINKATGSENVGLFYFISYILVLIVLFEFHKIIKIFGKSNTFFASLGIQTLSLIFLSAMAPGNLTLIFLVLYIFFGSLALVCLDIILESFSTDHKSGRIRGLHLMILDTGFILGPFLSTQLLEKYDFQAAFFVALLLNLIVLIIALSKLRGVNHEFKGSLNVDDIFKKIIRRKNVLRIYYISFVLEFFYAIMIIYSPIYLKSLGISWEQIGLIFTVMLIPFIILPYPAGFLADKRFGEKELLIASLFIMVLSTAAILFIDTSDVLLWTIVLFSTRIGAALIQTLRDSYFYKRIDGHDVDLINFFRTSMPTAYILAAVFSFFILSFYPINYVFMMLCALILSALWPAFRLADNKSEKELKSLEYISNQ